MIRQIRSRLLSVKMWSWSLIQLSSETTAMHQVDRITCGFEKSKFGLHERECRQGFGFSANCLDCLPETVMLNGSSQLRIPDDLLHLFHVSWVVLPFRSQVRNGDQRLKSTAV